MYFPCTLHRFLYLATKLARFVERDRHLLQQLKYFHNTTTNRAKKNQNWCLECGNWRRKWYSYSRKWTNWSLRIVEWNAQWKTPRINPSTTVNSWRICQMISVKLWKESTISEWIWTYLIVNVIAMASAKALKIRIWGNEAFRRLSRMPKLLWRRRKNQLGYPHRSWWKSPINFPDETNYNNVVL